jgi:uncharacterized membrane protein
MTSQLDRKAAVAAAAGVVAGVVAVVLGGAEVAALVAWVAAGATFLALAWGRAWKADAAATRETAIDEARTRRLLDGIIIGATLVSLVAVVFALIRSEQKDPIGMLSAILAVPAVVIAWALINSVYAFRYAHLYYHENLHHFTFNQSEQPTYSDFAFAAFTIGMAYEPGDIDESSTATRRIALGHALLAYGFGTVVIAVAINLVTSLGQSG